MGQFFSSFFLCFQQRVGPKKLSLSGRSDRNDYNPSLRERARIQPNNKARIHTHTQNKTDRAELLSAQYHIDKERKKKKKQGEKKKMSIACSSEMMAAQMN